MNDSNVLVGNIEVGDIIEKINGRTVNDIVRERKKWTNGSNDAVKLAYMCSLGYITYSKDSVVDVLLSRNGKKRSARLRCYAYLPPAKKDTVAWKILPGNIGYVHMGILKRDAIDKMFGQLMDTRALIIDLRYYPNGTVYQMCEYLYSGKSAFARDFAPNPDCPGTFIWKPAIEYGPDSTTHHKHYAGKIILLVNENTQSQAEWTAMAFQAVPGTITIGSQTSGADGDVSKLNLPGRYQTNMTGLGVFYPDGTATQQTGVKIDLMVRPTIKGIQRKRDELLERAMQIAVEK